MLNTRKKSLIALCLLITLLASGSSLADTSGQLTPEEKNQLQQELAQIEQQINQYQQDLNQIKGEKNTLQNKLKQLQKQQASLNLQIKATNLRINDISDQILTTQNLIQTNTIKSNELKQSLGEIIQIIYKKDNEPILYQLLTQDNLSEFLDEMESLSRISSAKSELMSQIEKNNQELNTQEEILIQQQTETSELLTMQTLQKGQVAGIVSEQNSLLSETKGKESNYQAILSETKKQAAAIRSRLYPLLEVSQQITFGQAVEIAKYAENLTGVRAAFLLAILTQESNLGKNVGTCNRPNDPPEKSYKVVMKPTRDIVPFEQITAELGLDPNTTPVSCPMKNRDGSFNGWGGAMGPAQFIPSTWMGYKDKVSAITGKTANPWDIRDAFIASAIKLKAGGAGTISGEWAAAMRYFSGGTNTKYRFYGDSVVNQANKYQQDIDNMNN